MLKEGAVVAVAGARKALFLIALLLWVALGGIATIVAAYKLLGILLTATLTTFGPFKPAEPTGAYYAIAVVIICVAVWFMWFSFQRIKQMQGLLAAPLQDEIKVAARA